MRASSQLVLIGAGIAAIVVAFVWRSLARRAQLTRLQKRLRFDDEPADRARAGHALVELGLPRAAKPILRAVVQEPDDRVRLSIALAIARRQWEPARAQRVVKVRGWASEELEGQGHPVRGFGPAVTRLADMGGPRPEDVENATGKPAAAPGTNGNGHGSSGDDTEEMIAYRVDEPPPAPPAPPIGSAFEAIRWVLPGISERIEP